MGSRELFVFLFLLGCVLFNWPFLNIFGTWLPYYLFGAWALLIAVMFMVAQLMRRSARKASAQQSSDYQSSGQDELL